MTTSSGSPRPFPDSVARWIGERELVEEAPEPALVTAMWNKSMATAADSLLPAISRDNALQLTYQAQLQAVTAMLRSRGLRVRSRVKHHYLAIETARALAKADGATTLADALDKLDGLRADRALAVYEPDPALAESVSQARSIMVEVLPGALNWLGRTDPNLARSLEAVPPGVLALAQVSPPTSVVPPKNRR